MISGDWSKSMGGCGPTKLRGGGSSVVYILCNEWVKLIWGGGGVNQNYFK